MKGEGSEETP